MYHKFVRDKILGNLYSVDLKNSKNGEFFSEEFFSEEFFSRDFKKIEKIV